VQDIVVLEQGFLVCSFTLNINNFIPSLRIEEMLLADIQLGKSSKGGFDDFRKAGVDESYVALVVESLDCFV
jgi:hypothetical protein